MNCTRCDCKLEHEEEADIQKMLADGKQMPQICTECLMQWVEEPAKTEWDSEINQPH